MSVPWRVPPGRAGRLWLHRRLEAAEHGVDLYERTLAILRREHGRRAADAARTGAEWAAACAAADLWALRTSLSGGRRGLRPAAGPVEVTVRWTQVMGVRLPDTASFTPPPPGPPGPLACSAAHVRARQYCTAALEAAARHAVALEAERALAGRIAVVRRRIRALKARWIPGLTALLAQIDLALEEAERADAARLLRALDAERVTPGRRSPAAGGPTR